VGEEDENSERETVEAGCSLAVKQDDRRASRGKFLRRRRPRQQKKGEGRAESGARKGVVGRASAARPLPSEEKNLFWPCNLTQKGAGI